ncbi:MAG TPA: isoprenylcysteine carboxylmethyltransferase family protein [Candidatus Acidoferrales bacterium]|nr:isoprenylcysteine carboxylmethyltransferase family protein [Candidatus Acidoferrales bacterium]
MTPGASLPPPWRTRWRVRFGYPVGIACFVLARPTPLMLACGGVVAAIGLLIRGSAAGHLRKHEALATTGPYAWTRNPLYFGSMCLAAGFLVATASWIAAAVAALYLAVFYPGVIRREEQELRAEYGAAFDAYASQAPRFWPRPPRGPAPASPTFSWAQYRRNREYQALVGAVISFAILAATMLWPAH